MILQMIALEFRDVTDEDLPVLIRHADEAGVQAICSARRRPGIEPQDLGEGGEETMVGEMQDDDENLAGLIHVGHRHSKAPTAQVDRLFDEIALGWLRLPLNADRQRDGDAIELAALPAGRLFGWVFRSHHNQDYSKLFGIYVL